MTGRDLYDRLCEAKAYHPVGAYDGQRNHRFTQVTNKEETWAAYEFLPDGEKRMLSRVAKQLVTRKGASRVK